MARVRYIGSAQSSAGDRLGDPATGLYFPWGEVVECDDAIADRLASYGLVRTDDEVTMTREEQEALGHTSAVPVAGESAPAEPERYEAPSVYAHLASPSATFSSAGNEEDDTLS